MMQTSQTVDTALIEIAESTGIENHSVLTCRLEIQLMGNSTSLNI